MKEGGVSTRNVVFIEGKVEEDSLLNPGEGGPPPSRGDQSACRLSTNSCCAHFEPQLCPRTKIPYQIAEPNRAALCFPSLNLR